METQKCTKCFKVLPIDAFANRKGKCRKPGAKHSECRECGETRRRNRYNTNNEVRSTVLDRCSNHAKKRRKQALNAYGHKCACCGESQYDFLTFDHINGRPEEHRRQGNNGSGFAGHPLVMWIIENNYPSSIQVLCYNCNCGKRTNKECPHKKLQDLDRNDQEDYYKDLYL